MSKVEIDRAEVHGAICDSIKELYARKNADYGDSFALLRRQYPNSICIRLQDKLNRLHQLSDPQYVQKVNDERIEDTLMDIANYAIMELTERKADAILAAEEMLL